jgi:L-amino acid N-acyltransferase YncA
MNATIRLAVAADAIPVQEIYRPAVERTTASFEIEPPSPAEMQRRIESTLLRWPWLVFERDREVQGYAYATAHAERAGYRWSANVSIYVREGHHRYGVGRALYTSLFELLQLQGYVAVYAGITLPNPASVGLHEAMRFTLVGVYRQVGYKFGAWHDVSWWQRSLQERPPDPAPPLLLAEAMEIEQWEAALTAGLNQLRRL